ncbi:uncharacterized protein LOC128206204 [Mya arenaria]|uniref:uncharacterized protein LOC128206204 n=1 Tax=Mya arenaria TaxID=6604 RepID=UPI0022E14FEF|nr:uncharacterized protein LOC128206204 [Mya arenaria]
MEDITFSKVVGKDIFLHAPSGDMRLCAAICELPDRNARACTYYCPMYESVIAATPASVTKSTSLLYETPDVQTSRTFCIPEVLLVVCVAAAVILIIATYTQRKRLEVVFSRIQLRLLHRSIPPRTSHDAEKAVPNSPLNEEKSARPLNDTDDCEINHLNRGEETLLGPSSPHRKEQTAPTLNP